MTDSSKTGKLYSASGAEHPEAVPAITKSSKMSRKKLSAFAQRAADFAPVGELTLDEAPVASNKQGFSAAKLGLILSVATFIPAVIETIATGKVGIITSAIFFIAAIFCAVQVKPFDGFAAWTVPAYVFLGAMLISANLGDVAADNFLIRQVSGVILAMSANYLVLVIVTPICWVIQQRKVVAAKRALHSA
jgi:hypothetical protein